MNNVECKMQVNPRKGRQFRKACCLIDMLAAGSGLRRGATSGASGPMSTFPPNRVAIESPPLRELPT
jgi:hypothetical protein